MKTQLKNIAIKLCRGLPFISMIVILLLLIFSYFSATGLEKLKVEIYQEELYSQSSKYQSALNGITELIDEDISNGYMDPFKSDELRILFDTYLAVYEYKLDGIQGFLFYRDTLKSNETELKIIKNDIEYTIANITYNTEYRYVLINTEKYNELVANIDSKYLYKPNIVLDLEEFKELYSKQYSSMVESEIIIDDWLFLDSKFINRINELTPTIIENSSDICEKYLINIDDNTKFYYNISVLPMTGLYDNNDETSNIVSRKLCFVIINNKHNIDTKINRLIDNVKLTQFTLRHAVWIITVITIFFAALVTYLFKYIDEKNYYNINRK